MPCDLSRYPATWRAFSAEIRFGRGNGQCECIGQCGLHSGEHYARRCVELHGKKAVFFKGTVWLTTAHLCDCNPPCVTPEHVIAACQRCHLRMDAKRKAAARRARRAAAIAETRKDLEALADIS